MRTACRKIRRDPNFQIFLILFESTKYAESQNRVLHIGDAHTNAQFNKIHRNTLTTQPNFWAKERVVIFYMPAASVNYSSHTSRVHVVYVPFLEFVAL